MQPLLKARATKIRCKACLLTISGLSPAAAHHQLCLYPASSFKQPAARNQQPTQKPKHTLLSVGESW